MTTQTTHKRSAMGQGNNLLQELAFATRHVFLRVGNVQTNCYTTKQLHEYHRERNVVVAAYLFML